MTKASLVLVIGTGEIVAVKPWSEDCLIDRLGYAHTKKQIEFIRVIE